MDTPYEKPAPYSDFLAALQRKVFSLAAISGTVFIVTFTESGNAIHAILRLFDLEKVTIVTTSPFQLLSLSTTIAMIAGMTALLAVLMYHTYTYMKDGLLRKERRLFIWMVLAGIALFGIGVLYGFALLYFYLGSVSQANLGIGIQNMWDVSTFLSQMVFTSLLLGFVFQFPIILTFLIRTGIMPVELLRKRRKLAFCAIFIFVGFLPPPDIFSTLIEAFPLIVLYELVIRINSSHKNHRPGESVPVTE